MDELVLGGLRLMAVAGIALVVVWSIYFAFLAVRWFSEQKGEDDMKYLETTNLFKGQIGRTKLYPCALPSSYVAKIFRRERNIVGRLQNDFEYWLIRMILR